MFTSILKRLFIRFPSQLDTSDLRPFRDIVLNYWQAKTLVSGDKSHQIAPLKASHQFRIRGLRGVEKLQTRVLQHGFLGGIQLADNVQATGQSRQGGDQAVQILVGGSAHMQNFRRLVIKVFGERHKIIGEALRDQPDFGGVALNMPKEFLAWPPKSP